MRATSRIFSYAVFGICLSVAAVFIAVEADTVSVKKIRSLVERELPVRSNAEEVEAFLAKHGLSVSFDKTQMRYQSIIRDVSKKPFVDKAIVIHLYVDDENKFTRAEVLNSYTAF